MKTVVFTSPFLDIAEFPDARITLARNTPQQVTDEQAAILLTNPDVRLASSPSPAPPVVSSAPPAPTAVSTPPSFTKSAPPAAVDDEEK